MCQKALNAVNEKTLVKTTLFSVDSGLFVNLSDKVRFKEIQSKSKTKIKLAKSKIRLHGYPNETSIPAVGQFDVLLEVKNKYVEANFVVVKGNRIRTFVRMSHSYETLGS